MSMRSPDINAVLPVASRLVGLEDWLAGARLGLKVCAKRDGEVTSPKTSSAPSFEVFQGACENEEGLTGLIWALLA